MTDECNALDYCHCRDCVHIAAATMVVVYRALLQLMCDLITLLLCCSGRNAMHSAFQPDVDDTFDGSAAGAR